MTTDDQMSRPAILDQIDRIRTELGQSENLVAFLAFAVLAATVGLTVLHGNAYVRGGAAPRVAYIGALLVQLLLVFGIGLIADRALVAGTRHHGPSWRPAVAIGAVAVLLALLPALVSTRQPLTVFLFVVVTIVYDGAVGALVGLARPWSWMGHRAVEAESGDQA